METLYDGPYDSPPPPDHGRLRGKPIRLHQECHCIRIEWATSAGRASTAADRVAAAAETAAAATATAAANAKSARAAIRVADVALAWVEAIHAKIFQATSESSMQPTSEKAVVAMEHLLPHEVAKWEMEMQEAAEIEERREEELRVAQVEEEKSLSVEESAVEYQCELWRSQYYEYYNLEDGAEDKDEDAINFSRGMRSPPMAACRQDKLSRSHLTPAMHRPA